MSAVTDFLATIPNHNTRLTYETALRSFEKTCKLYSKDPVTASKTDIRKICRDWLNRDDWGQSTQTIKIAALSAFYDWLVNEDWRVDNPMINVKPMRKTVETDMRVPTRDMYNKIYIYVENNMSIRDRVLFRLLTESGARVSEVVNIKFEDVHDDGVVDITIAKRYKSRRTAVRQSTVKLIRMYQREQDVPDSNFILGTTWTHMYGNKPMRPRSVIDRLEVLARSAGLAEEEVKICGHPHAWRHYWATEHVRNNTNTALLQAMGGWASANMIQKYVDFLSIKPEAVEFDDSIEEE